MRFLLSAHNLGQTTSDRRFERREHQRNRRKGVRAIVPLGAAAVRAVALALVDGTAEHGAASGCSPNSQSASLPIQIALIYELLDAHGDTARLADALRGPDLPWESHLEYLRALQRRGREILAQLELEVDG